LRENLPRRLLNAAGRSVRYQQKKSVANRQKRVTLETDKLSFKWRCVGSDWASTARSGRSE
jgi:hypothetical protein